VADALETPRQDMQQEASQKFDGVEPHDALAVPVLIVLPPECHLPVLQRQQAPISDGHPMRIAGEVTQHGLRTRERRHCILPITSPKQW
jgi:hypothetical protein